MDDAMQISGKSSIFNEASYQMLRIHRLQEIINICNTNPTIFDAEENLYNYEIIFYNLNSLFSEASPKCGDNEIQKGVVIKRMIQSFIQENPIHEKEENIVSHNDEIIFNKKNWIKLREMLFNYNLFVRKLLDKHKLTSPDQKDPSKSILQY